MQDRHWNDGPEMPVEKIRQPRPVSKGLLKERRCLLQTGQIPPQRARESQLDQPLSKDILSTVSGPHQRERQIDFAFLGSRR